jgi:hypothetical protein
VKVGAVTGTVIVVTMTAVTVPVVTVTAVTVVRGCGSRRHPCITSVSVTGLPRSFMTF